MRVDPRVLGGLLCNPFSRLRIAPDAAQLSPAGDCARRMVAAASLWPDKLWFWLGTVALVAALAALPSKIPSAAAPDVAADALLARNVDAPAEDRPSSGSALPYSQANIRFCRFQQVRLEAIGPLTTRADLAVFQALANEWNARCVRYRYLPADKRVVEAEVIDRRGALEGEGRALLSAWRRKIHFGVAAPASPNPSGAWHSSSGGFVADTAALPSLITSGIPGNPDTEPVSWPLLRAPSLALLHQSVASRVQRRLNDLGYIVSPADGTWGTSSRIALRRFKEANGLLRDDILDAETVTRLFSTSAVHAPPAASARPEDASAFETAYPPPVGATMNPLNREDAEQIQHRLADLGYYVGSDGGIWGAASRNALRAFKAVHRLSNENEWDAATEQALNAGEAVHSPEPAAANKQKPKSGGVEAKFASANVRAAVPVPTKRPAQAAASTKSAARATSSAARDAPRPPAPIPAPALVAAGEP